VANPESNPGTNPAMRKTGRLVKMGENGRGKWKGK
jgi:hypothetical protein